MNVIAKYLGPLISREQKAKWVPMFFFWSQNRDKLHWIKIPQNLQLGDTNQGL